MTCAHGLSGAACMACYPSLDNSCRYAIPDTAESFERCGETPATYDSDLDEWYCARHTEHYAFLRENKQ